MSSTFTTNKHIDKPDPGTDYGTWGTNVNSDFDVIDRAFGGSVSYSLTGSTLQQNVYGATGTPTAPYDYQNLYINLSGNTGSSYTFQGTGYIVGTNLYVNVTSGSVSVGNLITATSISSGTTITGTSTGTVVVGAITYTIYPISISQTVYSSTTPGNIYGNNAIVYLTFPTGVGGMWIVSTTGLSGSAAIFANTAASGTNATNGVYLAAGATSLIFSDGSTISFADGRFATGGAGATGGGSDQIFYQNGQTVTTNYTIPSTVNAMTAGPVTINANVTVTINEPTVWTIV
jgi:hypothetical protein